MKTIFALGFRSHDGFAIASPTFLGQASDVTYPVQKGERDAILSDIKAGKEKLSTVAAWWDANIPNGRQILGPKIDTYSSELQNAMSLRDVVDTVEWRMSSETPGTWLIHPSELKKVRSWQASSEALAKMVGIAAGTPLPSTPGVPEGKTKDLIVTGGVVVLIGVAIAALV